MDEVVEKTPWILVRVSGRIGCFSTLNCFASAVWPFFTVTNARSAVQRRRTCILSLPVTVSDVEYLFSGFNDSPCSYCIRTVPRALRAYAVGFWLVPGCSVLVVDH